MTMLAERKQTPATPNSPAVIAPRATSINATASTASDIVTFLDIATLLYRDRTTSENV